MKKIAKIIKFNRWAVAGKLEERYSYSPAVYNNFPWINLSELEKKKIKTMALAILEARNNYSNNSLAELYDELAMPVELRKAHQANDKAVIKQLWKLMD